MSNTGIALHGPQGPTGIGYGLKHLYEALVKSGRQSILVGQKSGWSNSMYHIIVEQPAFIEPSAPWIGLVPTFELPLRDDEKKHLRLPSPYHRMFCLNPFIQEQVRQINPNMPEKCFPLIQQGANPTHFSDVRRNLGSIGTVGKYEPRKGYDSLLPALHCINLHRKYIMATSPLHTSEEIQSIQKASQKYDVILLPWEKSYENVLAFLSSLHVFVSTSHAEGWGLSVTEALAQGCIVVASDIHAHRHQYNILKATVGEEEASYRLRLVPTKETSIIGHDRWYPGFLYMGKKWLSCDQDILLNEIAKAIGDDPPGPWSDSKPFPLSWKAAANRLSHLVDLAVNQKKEEK